MKISRHILIVTVVLIAASFMAAIGTSAASGQWQNIDIPGVSNDFNNPSNNYGYNTVVVDQANPSVVFVGTNYQGIYKSANSGSTWVKIDTGTGSNMVDGGRIWSLVIDPFNHNTLYAASGYGFGGPLKSTDGGVSWTNTFPSSNPVEQQIGTNDIYNVSVDPYTPNHLLAAFHYYWLPGASDTGVIESTDGGVTWIRHNPAGGWGNGNSVWFLNNSTTWLLGSQNAGFWRTTNSGSTWNQVSSNNIGHGGVNSLYRETSGVFYTAFWNGVLKSTDNGATWTNISSGLPYAWFETVIGDGANLYTAPSFPTGGDYGSAHGPWYTVPISGGNWTAYNAQQTCDTSNSVCNGPVMMARDSTNNILYSVNWLGGLWKLSSSGSATATIVTPTRTPTVTQTPVPTQTPTVVSSKTPTPASTATPAAAITDTPTGVVTTSSSTPSPTLTATPTNSATPVQDFITIVLNSGQSILINCSGNIVLTGNKLDCLP